VTDIDPKQVAKHLDRRQQRRRVFVLLAALGLAIAAILYLRCGRDWGPGGKTNDTGAAAPVADAGPRGHCGLRLAGNGLSLDGQPSTRDAAIAACKQATTEVLVTGDARQGDWDELRAALDAAGIHYSVREPTGAAPDAGSPSGPP